MLESGNMSVHSCIICFYSLANLPRVTIHPQDSKDAVPGNSVLFTVRATGMQPLNYQWQHNTGSGRNGWKNCDVEQFPGADRSTLIIPDVQKSKEGRYHCIVSNNAGSNISKYATLTVG